MNTDHVYIALSTSDEFAPYASVTLQSIMEQASSHRQYNIAVLAKGFKRETSEIFGLMASLRANIHLHLIDVTEITQGRLPSLSRFHLLDILPEIKKILYIDGDMMVLCDIGEIYDTELGDAWVGAVRDYPISGRPPAAKRKDIGYIRENVGILNPEQVYFNAGLMLMNLDALRENGITAKRCYELWDMNPSGHRFWDQDVLNPLCINHVKYLPYRWNVMRFPSLEYFSDAQDAERVRQEFKIPQIIHFSGGRKVWGLNYSGEFGAWYAWRVMWWEYARRSPFYRNIWQSYIGECLTSPNKGMESQILHLSKCKANMEEMLREAIRLPYYQEELHRIRWKIHLSWGSKKKKYSERKVKLKAKIKKIETYLKDK